VEEPFRERGSLTESLLMVDSTEVHSGAGGLNFSRSPRFSPLLNNESLFFKLKKGGTTEGSFRP